MARKRRRALMIAAVAAGAAAFGLVSLLRERRQPTAAPWPLGLGSRADRLRMRITEALQGRFGETLERYEGAPDDEADERLTIEFEWGFASNDRNVVAAALAAEDLDVSNATPIAGNRDVQTVATLEAAGIHLDEDTRDEFSPLPRLHVVGRGNPRRLARAVERTLDTRHDGLIVDTSRNVVEIDQRRDVGRGNVLLVDGAGSSRLLRHGSMRSLVAALRAAAQPEDDASAPAPPDAPSAATAPTEESTGHAEPASPLSQLAPTVDEFIRELEHDGAPGRALTMQLADHLSAVRHCRRCNAAILDVGPVADALAHHYGAPLRRDEIGAALAVSAIETGNPADPEYCSAHGAGQDLN